MVQIKKYNFSEKIKEFFLYFIVIVELKYSQEIASNNDIHRVE